MNTDAACVLFYAHLQDHVLKSLLQVAEQPEAVPVERQTLSVIRHFLEQRFAAPSWRQSTACSAAHSQSALPSRAIPTAESPRGTVHEPCLLPGPDDSADDVALVPPPSAPSIPCDLDHGPVTVRKR